MTASDTPRDQVDEVQDWGGRLSPADVHHVLFSRAGLGRRGYDEAEVDFFLERVQQELRLIAEKTDLRDEIARLKSQLEQAGSAPSSGMLSTEEANLQAVRLLAAAQQTADLYVADAEKYSQRVTSDARQHSEELLADARAAARKTVEDAERLAEEAASGAATASGERSREDLDQQVAYLRTFGQVCRAQLRAYLEALLRDVEEEWGGADPGVLAGPVRPALPAGVHPPAAPDGAGVTPTASVTRGDTVVLERPSSPDRQPAEPAAQGEAASPNGSANGVTRHSRTSPPQEQSSDARPDGDEAPRPPVPPARRGRGSAPTSTR
ncbi:MAG: DivIVA domain-containing protein [Actinomycetota bacterium]|jgi:DivIVA domain-containing protein|nr:DivIVA domain-containing protein [Actinomycetota bacterium]